MKVSRANTAHLSCSVGAIQIFYYVNWGSSLFASQQLLIKLGEYSDGLKIKLWHFWSTGITYKNRTMKEFFAFMFLVCLVIFLIGLFSGHPMCLTVGMGGLGLSLSCNRG